MEPTPKQRRGFSAMSPERRVELARKGGILAHLRGTTHEFNHEEAVRAGRLGGLASWEKRRPKEI